MDLLTTYLIYGLPALVLLVWHVRRRRRLERQSLKALESTGAAEPASLHPVIDPAVCIGCSSCVKSCPEQAHHTVLGIVDGRAVLVSPGDCIGHGACKTACPVNAITLVFGSERRGIDIPVLTPKFESTVPGIFVAGELGGMGLIRNALEQGRQAVDAIAERRRAVGQELDLVIVGAGPSGFAATLT
ncbi:MAG TPA: 4Fe-4S dicluster domain-containing protein, partial [Gemmatimonadales bacterium]|nr:4Fe-4S dicluster domain-containing protein [Gemmatimonadales bacterium]